MCISGELIHVKQELVWDQVKEVRAKFIDALVHVFQQDLKQRKVPNGQEKLTQAHIQAGRHALHDLSPAFQYGKLKPPTHKDAYQVKSFNYYFSFKILNYYNHVLICL